MDYKEKVIALLKSQELSKEQKEKLENIFPELTEYEDEKIRKAIHICLDWLDGRKDYQPKGVYTIRDMIDWVIKQDKKISADKVIEWIDEHVPTKFEDMQNYVNQFKQDFGL